MKGFLREWKTSEVFPVEMWQIGFVFRDYTDCNVEN
jgi:hypothetical protein